MALAEVILTGPIQRLSDALAAFRKMGTVDESTILVAEHLDRVTVGDRVIRTPATRFTAEVTP